MASFHYERAVLVVLPILYFDEHLGCLYIGPLKNKCLKFSFKSLLVLTMEFSTYKGNRDGVKEFYFSIWISWISKNSDIFNQFSCNVVVYRLKRYIHISRNGNVANHIITTWTPHYGRFWIILFKNCFYTRLGSKTNVKHFQWQGWHGFSCEFLRILSFDMVYIMVCIKTCWNWQNCWFLY